MFIMKLMFFCRLNIHSANLQVCHAIFIFSQLLEMDLNTLNYVLFIIAKQWLFQQYAT